MGVLKNARHETFSQGLARGMTADAAYVNAGFKSNRGNAARLNSNESIKARVEEIKERIAEKAEWTAADRLADLADIARANKGKDPSTSIRAIAEANKMQGSHAPVKSEHDVTNPIAKMMKSIMSSALPIGTQRLVRN